MIFGSYKSEWSDELARAFAQVPCENPIKPSQFESINCGDHLLYRASLCPPCSARKYVARYPEESAS